MALFRSFVENLIGNGVITSFLDGNWVLVISLLKAGSRGDAVLELSHDGRVNIPESLFIRMPNTDTKMQTDDLWLNEGCEFPNLPSLSICGGLAART